MSHIIFWILGFGTLWLGLKLFDDEILLIVTLIFSPILVLLGLLSSPPWLQMGIEILLIVALFHVCMECISRGNDSL